MSVKGLYQARCYVRRRAAAETERYISIEEKKNPHFGDASKVHHEADILLAVYGDFLTESQKTDAKMACWTVKRDVVEYRKVFLTSILMNVCRCASDEVFKKLLNLVQLANPEWEEAISKERKKK